MEGNQLILSRPIIHQSIRWFHIFILSLVYCSANAQQSTGSRDTYRLYSNFDPTIAIIVLILICAFFFIGIFSIFLRQCTDTTEFQTVITGRLHRAGLDPSVIEKFPVFVYSEVKNIKIGRETLECAVCLSEFEDDETLRLLPKCNHVFHPECIDEWLSSHVTCPVCRAELTPDCGETQKNSSQQTTTTEPNQQFSASNLTETTNEISISVNEEQNRDSQPRVNKNRPPRSGISGKFPRSHSTGHSLVQAGENIERYTLRLPEELRTHMLASAKLKRAISFNVILATEGSSRKGYRSGGEDSNRGKQISRSDLWGLLMNTPFVSRGGSVKASKTDNDGDSVNGRNLFASVKKPLNCLNAKVEGGGEPPSRSRPVV
ncbi:hypothetical protein JCGZ_18673 [Jatropha curcas]|uniref:RING-type E3 ubiquitin transferase n=1 Tax=Jatropha curcas TaxID=180498 RepID=A0A067K3Z9_JATCU|nr:RING-H2 finger protein ATL32 [Jatropha curcas]KDP29738.1 hypothetical protein JCGZ_18673 [Jatropha curcas]